jgi:hypothetical protein
VIGAGDPLEWSHVRFLLTGVVREAPCSMHACQAQGAPPGILAPWATAAASLTCQDAARCDRAWG